MFHIGLLQLSKPTAEASYNTYERCLYIGKKPKHEIGMKFYNHRAKRHFLTKSLVIHFPFLLPSFIEGKKRGGKNNQNRGKKQCISARSKKMK